MNNLEWIEHLKYKGERAVVREFNNCVTAKFKKEAKFEVGVCNTEVYSLELKVKARRGRREVVISMLKNHLYKDLIGDLNDLRSYIISGCVDIQALRRIDEIQRKYDR